MFYLFKVANSICNRQANQTRNLWQWLNIIFNSVDEHRRKLYGPDRTCAEWLLRNGAAVKWTTADEYLRDYNRLPPENIKVYIKEVDASDSSISHHGFPHFAGCKHINKIILHKCGYIENEGLPLLKSLKNSLIHLQVSSCGNISDEGLNSLGELSNLENLIIFDLPYVKHKEDVLKKLKQKLTKCNIDFK